MSCTQIWHIQEIIVQNFRAKPDTRMAEADEPELDDLMWTIAMARLSSARDEHPGAAQSQRRRLRLLIDAGINDWGGVSPVTPDHVNPEAPWPEIDAFANTESRRQRTLVPRLAAYPLTVSDLVRWQDAESASAYPQS